MRVTLNLATRPFSDAGPALKRLRIAIGVMAIVAIGLGLGLRAFHQKAEQARAREHSLDQKITAITQERQSFQDLMRLPVNAQVLAHASALNQIFDEKAFSWTLAMEDLETVLPGGVQVVTLEPIRAKDGQITLHLRVVGPRDRAVDLVKNLEHSKHFVLPRIVGESSESTGGPGETLQPVSASNRFNLDLLADYNADALVETKPAPKSEKESADKAPAVAGTAQTARAGSAPAVPVHHGQVPAGAAHHSTRPPYSGVSQPPAVKHPKPNAGGPQ
jgi:type IV pilus assembly protein PilN